MLVIVKKPGSKAERLDISSELESLQSQVEGYIEFVHIRPLHEKGISVIVNDEGKLQDLNTCIVMVDSKYDIVESLEGNVLFTGIKYTEDGPSCDSLSEEQIKFLNEFIFENDAKYSCDKGYIIDSVRVD